MYVFTHICIYEHVGIYIYIYMYPYASHTVDGMKLHAQCIYETIGTLPTYGTEGHACTVFIVQQYLQASDLVKAPHREPLLDPAFQPLDNRI